MSLFGPRGRSARPTRARKMPLVGSKATPTYSVGDRVEFVQYNNYMREYHDVVPGAQGTVSREPDGELDGPPTGMLVLWDSCGQDVRVSFSEVKKVEEKGSTMTDFKVGDTIRLEGELWGAEPGDPEEGSLHKVTGIDSDGDAIFLDEKGSTWYASPQDSAYYGFEVVKEGKTLAEKRADDFRVLEEASDRWSHSVQSPSHYKFPGGGQVIDITRHLPFLHGNIVKYVCRAGRKGSEVEDLLKARKYLDWAIEDAQKESN